MIWSPLQWSRPAWDILFIIDFVFSAILFVPQILAWVYARKEGLQGRALASWLVFCLGALAAAGLGKRAQAPYSTEAVIAALVILTAVFLLPAIRKWGVRLRPATWNRTGFVAALAYIAFAAYLHHAALRRVDDFVAQLHLDARSSGALPFPPSIWHWDGLVLTPHGVYETRLDLSQMSTPNVAEALANFSYRFYPDAQPNHYIDAALRLREVQAVLWFARFPVTRFRQEGNDAVVEISDLRFARTQPDHPAPFTYRVRFDAKGNVISQGWSRPR
jgi:hypothetical protein